MRLGARSALVFVLVAGAAACAGVLGVDDARYGAGGSDGGTADAGLSDGGESGTAGDGGSSDAPTPAKDAGSAYANAVLADNPVVYFRFGEKPGTQVAISEVGTIKGKYPLAGATLGVAGANPADPDTAVHLAKSEGITFDPGVDFAGDPNAAFSVEVWVKPEAVLGAVAGDFGFVVDHEAHTGQRSGWGVLFYPVDKNFVFERWQDDNDSLGTPNNGPTVPLDQWHHFVGVWPGSSTVLVWVDGQVYQGGSAPLTMQTLSTWSVGNQTGCTCNQYTGAIDELAVYDHALPQDRILAHYQAVAPK